MLSKKNMCLETFFCLSYRFPTVKIVCCIIIVEICRRILNSLFNTIFNPRVVMSPFDRLNSLIVNILSLRWVLETIEDIFVTSTPTRMVSWWKTNPVYSSQSANKTIVLHLSVFVSNCIFISTWSLNTRSFLSLWYK